MIQDIEPRKFDIAYKNVEAEDKDYILLFDGESVLMKQPDGQDSEAEFLTFKEIISLKLTMNIKDNATYLFSIDDDKYFMANLKTEIKNIQLKNEAFKLELIDLQGKEIQGGLVLVWHAPNVFRTMRQKWIGFVGISAVQINRWQLNHKYCGRCGTSLKHSNTERCLVCENCNAIEYPKISPAIIVGVIDGDKLLLTKYADRPYKRYALIAGFSEVGESLEATVHREVMEEVGLRVKDITYYKSQPWSFSDSLLVGFFARLEGNCKVTLADGELSEGTWFSRDEIPINKEEIALTSEMIRYFASGNVVFKQNK